MAKSKKAQIKSGEATATKTPEEMPEQQHKVEPPAQPQVKVPKLMDKPIVDVPPVKRSIYDKFIAIGFTRIREKSIQKYEIRIGAKPRVEVTLKGGGLHFFEDHEAALFLALACDPNYHAFHALLTEKPQMKEETKEEKSLLKEEVPLGLQQ